ncbi:LCP family protein [Streptomyces luteolus]|uniref:LCP family protein n=1 Tax=Streptomyces luteolus TaxID=3043615 RepID=A0ABT6SZJ0_9ACTN|nr:LCP family protein [Streptomyces sp. B-S-A12]MDI3421026.1 LCP family protein [Streptomyces sp. B-S-A12]
MNDRQYEPYDPYAEGRYEIVGYDEYGQPVYQQVSPQQAQQPPQQPQGYDPYGNQQQPQGYGYDPYAEQSGYDTGGYDTTAYGNTAYDNGGYGQGGYGDQRYGDQGYGDPAYGQGRDTAYDPYGQAAGTGQQQRVDEQTAWVPQQPHPGPQRPEPQRPEQPRPEPQPQTPPQRNQAQVPGQSRAEDQYRDEYRTEQFQFVEEPDDESEDVIDWLKFTESRTERREEAKRRGRNRLIALVVVLALALTGGVGYLWYAGKLPGLSGSEGGGATASGPQKRDVIVLHLHNTKKRGTSTALLVDNTTNGQGYTVLLPNSLSVTDEDGAATTLGKSVDEDGAGGTRQAIDSLLGTSIEGTWRLDTPYLNNLVELVGNIEIDTDANVPDPEAKKKGEAPLVKKGEKQTLSGPMAVAYATYRAPGESETAQLERFGAVMHGVLRKISSDPDAATTTVKTLTQILDPSLKENDLGASLAKLAEHAKTGAYKTSVLPVQQDGTLTEQATRAVVKDVLGGKVKNPDQGDTVRISVSGAEQSVQSARVDLVNGGWAVVQGRARAGTASQVTYADAAQKAEAEEVAKTLDLPSSAVRKGKVAANADVGVVLGADYRAG